MAKPNIVSKQDLIESAKRCIVEQGIQNLTLNSVAKGANVTQGTVFYHFRTKEQLMFEVVKDLCRSSWESLKRIPETGHEKIRSALDSARSRCTPDSFYHQLFLSLVISGFQNEKIKEQLGNLLEYENRFLTEQLATVWPQSPIEGVSLKTWGILLKAIIDGLALQALLSKDFPVDEIFKELELMVHHLTQASQANLNEEE
ncbi:TetR/AcrR family transcriptional regulator [Thermicanus aegyptius]|uniref:TetR/AcrR family transcriptional regulator n=1 Tax=Thermicanus aegyptius TaxID=94009 RepID=UPI00041E4200|nr:TetR/AcrR family transcriptional regulator [Thermicanus aegyptius]